MYQILDLTYTITTSNCYELLTLKSVLSYCASAINTSHRHEASVTLGVTLPISNKGCFLCWDSPSSESPTACSLPYSPQLLIPPPGEGFPGHRVSPRKIKAHHHIPSPCITFPPSLYDFKLPFLHNYFVLFALPM